jgi:replicative DNA helicase
MNLRRDTRPVHSILGEVLDALADVQSREDGLGGLPSGFTSLDRNTLGWQKADLIVILRLVLPWEKQPFFSQWHVI